MMLATLRDGPILAITIELNHHQVVFRDHRCTPQRDRTHGLGVATQELAFSKDIVCCLRQVPSGMRSAV